MLLARARDEQQQKDQSAEQFYATVQVPPACISSCSITGHIVAQVADKIGKLMNRCH
jgi:hypothetical protein